MKAGPANFGWPDAGAIVARWFLGVVFLYLGLHKALHPVEFLKLVRQYEITDSPWFLTSVAAGLPWFEVICGLLLLTGVAVRGTAALVILMLVPFSLAVLHRALALQVSKGIPFCAVKFDCGCGNGEEFICGKLLENAGLLALAAFVLLGRGRQLCARYGLWGVDRNQ